MTAVPGAPRPLPLAIQLLGGLLGVAGVLLPFSNDLSPIAAIRQHTFASLAAAAFIAPLITILAIRLIQRGRFGPIARGVAWLVAAAFLAIYLRGWAELLLSSSDASDASRHSLFTSVLGGVIIVLPLLLLVFGGWRVIAAVRQGHSARASILALQSMYLVNAAYALAGFSGAWQSGAWCILGAAVIHLYLVYSPRRTLDIA